MKNFIVTTFLTLIFSLATYAREAPASRYEKLELFNKVLHLVESQYYREVDTNKLIEGAIKGMMDTLDPHSSFLSADIFERMQSETAGEFGGLGIEVAQKDGILYVTTPIVGTPAFKAGIKPRDKIVEIDHEPIVGIDMGKAVEKMRGEPGSKVTLGVLREGFKGIKQIVVKRQIIKIEPVKYQLIDNNIAYLKLAQFQKRSSESIVNALKKLTAKAEKHGGLKAILLDLRYNPGGLLDQAVDVSSIFLKEGVVVSTEARDPNNKDIRYVKKTGYKNLNTPLGVLINGASASASEIVAGAIQDHKRGIIMGKRSFGKGSVQTVAQIDKENGLKLTIAQYLTPKSRRIQALGIDPDVELEEVNWKEFLEIKKSDNYIREQDLRNHLVATVETEEEKRMRMEKERIDRKKRTQRLKSAQSGASEKEEDTLLPYDPKDDYQVKMAINYLKGLQVLKGSI